jgi:hypothetical protein
MKFNITSAMTAVLIFTFAYICIAMVINNLLGIKPYPLLDITVYNIVWWFFAGYYFITHGRKGAVDVIPKEKHD